MLCDNSWDTDVASCLTTLLPHTTYLLHFSHQSSMQLSRKECWYQLFGMCCSNAKELTFRSAAPISGLLQVDVERNGAGAVVCTHYREVEKYIRGFLCIPLFSLWSEMSGWAHLGASLEVLPPARLFLLAIPAGVKLLVLCLSTHISEDNKLGRNEKEKGYRSQNCQNLISLF